MPIPDQQLSIFFQPLHLSILFLGSLGSILLFEDGNTENYNKYTNCWNNFLTIHNNPHQGQTGWETLHIIQLNINNFMMGLAKRNIFEHLQWKITKIIKKKQKTNLIYNHFILSLYSSLLVYFLIILFFHIFIIILLKIFFQPRLLQWIFSDNLK